MVRRSYKISYNLLWSTSFFKINPNEKFELSEQVKVDGKLKKKFYQKRFS